MGWACSGEIRSWREEEEDWDMPKDLVPISRTRPHSALCVCKRVDVGRMLFVGTLFGVEL